MRNASILSLVDETLWSTHRPTSKGFHDIPWVRKIRAVTIRLLFNCKLLLCTIYKISDRLHSLIVALSQEAHLPAITISKERFKGTQYIHLRSRWHSLVDRE